jgi:hypothetical protein
MVKRGFIRLTGFPPRRIFYYLTPKGFAEKAKLTLHCFYCNIHHYAEIKKQIAIKLLDMQNKGVKRVVFYGVSDEMEVAYVTLQGLHMKLVGIVDEEQNRGKVVFGFKVISPKEIKDSNMDAILITSVKDQNSYIQNLNKQKECSGIKIFTV